MCKNAVFEELYNTDVSRFTETKQNGLSYLSWSYAIAQMTNKFEDFDYGVETFGSDNLPYVFDQKTGYMVFCWVKANGVKKRMWLPVMDDRNMTMLDHPYEFKTKKGTYTVNACSMFDINKTIMRCVVKCIAMFGLGLQLYGKLDLDNLEEEVQAKPQEQQKQPNTTNTTPKQENKPQEAEKPQIFIEDKYNDLVYKLSNIGGSINDEKVANYLKAQAKVDSVDMNDLDKEQLTRLCIAMEYLYNAKTRKENSNN